MIAKLLYTLTEKERKFSWNAECQRSFDELKKSLISPPVLIFLEAVNQFVLDVDASEHGLGRVLSPSRIVPSAQTKEVLEKAHDSSTGKHFEMNKTLDRIRKRFYWIGCKQEVKEWCEDGPFV
ncbi:uncharacterized protein LOC122526644 [Polistes fuscatus]|uniref:uncharacterized protein LOC122526644 n=1 Tax=Polistes fuscatus TaxID=30207 RepID=UPI001CA7C28C|nr:uncharacterized protein LOC122526644 [Polistes fuscatus]